MMAPRESAVNISVRVHYPEASAIPDTFRSFRSPALVNPAYMDVGRVC